MGYFHTLCRLRANRALPFAAPDRRKVEWARLPDMVRRFSISSATTRIGSAFGGQPAALPAVLPMLPAVLYPRCLSVRLLRVAACAILMRCSCMLSATC